MTTEELVINMMLKHHGVDKHVAIRQSKIAIDFTIEQLKALQIGFCHECIAEELITEQIQSLEKQKEELNK